MKIIGMQQNFIDMLPDKNICLLGLQGSRMLGLAQNNDADYDYRGVYVASNEELLSFNRKPKETIEFGNSEDDNADFVLHEVEKFFNLAVKGNPSVINLFFVPKFNIKNNIGSEIIANRNLFFGERAIRAAYGRYALSQIMYVRRGGEERAGRKEKHMRHCFRLFDNGKELLETGNITMPLKDPQFYLDLGKMVHEPGGLDRLEEMFKQKYEEFKNCKSILPEEPNLFLIDKLLLKIRNSGGM